MNNYIHVFCAGLISSHDQIKSKPILERRMIGLINDRDILITKSKFHVQKRHNIEKFRQKIHFFLISFCSPVPTDLDRDIWQIISKLVVFYETIIGKAQAFTSFALEGGVQV